MAVVAVALAGTARADDLAGAKASFEAGAQAFEAGNYVAASQAFEQAYALAPRPAILFSIAQAERKQYYVDQLASRLTKAEQLYRKYLASVPQGGRRDDAVQGLAEVQSVLRSLGPAPVASVEPPKRETRLSIYSLTRGGQILVDQKPVGVVPSSPEVAPGRHHVTVLLDGYFPFERDVDVTAGTLAPVDAELQARPAQLMVVAPDGSRVTIDGRPIGELPLAAPVEVPAGHHFLTIAHRGHEPEAVEVEVGRGEYKLVRTGLEKTTQRQASYVVLGGAAVAAIVGGVLTGVAVAKQSDASDVLDAGQKRNLGPADLARYDDARSKRDAFRTGAGVAFGAAAGLAVTGVLLYAIDDPPVRSAPSLRESPRAPTPARLPDEVLGATPLLGPGFVGGSLGGRF